MRFVSFLLLSFAVCLASDQWVEVKSPHFAVITDAGDRRGREVALRFEQMRQTFGNLMGTEVRTPRPIQILAFKNTKGIRQVSPIFKGKVVELAGLYQKGRSEDFIALDMSSEGEYKWQTVFHEYAHLLLNSNTVQYAPWFDEGFAEFFSTIDFSGKNAVIGRAPMGAAEMIVNNRLMPVAQLFAVRHDSSTYNESGDHRSLFYAESWLLTHYSYDKKLRAGLSKFAVATRDGAADEQLFRKYLGMGYGDLDKALEAYVHGNKITGYQVPLPPTFDLSSFAARPLTDTDALVAIANMHANEQDRQQQAVEEFKQVLERDPKNVKAQSTLGYVYLMRHDFASAEPYLDRAAASGSDDPMVHYYYAMLMQMSGSAAKDPARQQKELQAAITLNPSLAEAYDLLGINRRLASDFDAAIAAGKRAVELDRRNDLYAMNLLGYMLAARKLEEASPLIERLKNSSDPRVRANLPSMEAYIERAHAYESVIARSGSETTSTVSSQTSDVVYEIKQMKATLLQVDCSGDAATLFLRREGETKLLQFRVRPLSELALQGESSEHVCGLKNRAVTAVYSDDGKIHGLSFAR